MRVGNWKAPFAVTGNGSLLLSVKNKPPVVPHRPSTVTFTANGLGGGGGGGGGPTGVVFPLPLPPQPARIELIMPTHKRHTRKQFRAKFLPRRSKDHITILRQIQVPANAQAYLRQLLELG